MTTILEAIGDYLVTQSQGTLGTDLFLGRLPASAPDLVVVVYETAGQPPDDQMGAGVPHLEKPGIMIKVRAAREDYTTGRDRIKAIRDLLAALSNTTLSGINVLRVTPSSEPAMIGYDQSSRPEWSANFATVVYR